MGGNVDCEILFGDTVERCLFYCTHPSPPPSRQFLAPTCPDTAYPYDWRGFVGAKKMMSLDGSVPCYPFSSLCSNPTSLKNMGDIRIGVVVNSLFVAHQNFKRKWIAGML
jgi:hypothetical protein